jgi:hypothetical protein
MNSMLPSTYNSRSSFIVKDRHLQPQKKQRYELLRYKYVSRSSEREEYRVMSLFELSKNKPFPNL